MGRISEEDIRRVREATDIVALISEKIVLKQRGREFWGCCPFHNEKTPSFKIDPASQYYHCFGCGEGGNVYQFLMKSEGMEFPDAVRYLAQRANIEISETGGGMPSGKKARLQAVCQETADYYHTQLMRAKSEDANSARSYLSNRGLGGSIPKDWLLGFAPGRGALIKHLKSKGFTYAEMVEADVAVSSQRDGKTITRDRFYNRIMFPIKDMQGRVIAFGGRIIGKGEPKYINTKDTPLFHKSENLYALDVSKSAITSTGTAVVVEGYTDVIAMHSAGFKNTVATLGTALTPQHIKTLSRFAQRIVYLFDGDEAGLRAADRASGLIDSLNTPEAAESCLVAVIPGQADPAEYCAAQGSDAMQKVLDSAQPLLRFSINRRLSQWDLTVPEQRNKALQDVVTLLVPVRGSLLALDYVNELADRFGVDNQIVQKALDKARIQPRYTAESSTSPESSREKPADEVKIPSSDEALLEQKMLAMYASYPMIRQQAAPLLDAYQWLYPLHNKIFQELKAINIQLDAPSTYEALDRANSMVVSILTSLSLDIESQNAIDAIAAMISQLTVSRYEQQIKEGNARLRHPGNMSNDEFDELFKQVAALQKELNDFRANAAK